MKRPAFALVALLVAAAHFATFGALSRPLVTDIRYYVYFAWRVTQGDVPHTDFFDNKTQLATFLGAAFHAVGDALGGDPVIAIRVGFLGITVLGGWLLYRVHRRIGGGSEVCGFLGLAPYLAFTLIGALPAIGNVPKVAMAVLASAAALLAGRGRWRIAGVCGALAFMDWQIGALVWLAVFVAAVVHGDSRPRAALDVVLGGLLGVAPFVLYYLVTGGLADAFRQTIAASWFRGSTSMERTGTLFKFERIQDVVAWAERPWIVYGSLLGVPAALGLAWTRRRAAEGALLTSLCVYHVGALAFHSIDFAGYGDLVSALHSVAFFGGCLLLVVHRVLHGGWCVREGRAGRWIAAATLVAGFAIARPAWLRPAEELPIRGEVPAYDFADQREVAAGARDAIGNRRALFLHRSELLSLMPLANPLPIIYWNDATWYELRASAEEPQIATLRRLIADVDPEVIVWGGRLAGVVLGTGYDRERVRASSGTYSVALEVKR